MGFFVGGGLSFALCVVFFLVAGAKARKAFDVASTATSSAAELRTLAEDVAREIGGGAFSRVAELKGRAVAVEALRAEYSGTECVWYECTATRLWEEEDRDAGREGGGSGGMRQGSDVVSTVRREPPFRLEDATGGVLVDPRGATVEAEKTWSRFEPAAGRGTLRIGSVEFDLGAHHGGAGSRRTTGYRFEETCIPSGRELYVLGEASDEGGELRVRKPAKGRFLVSTRGEEEILRSARRATIGFRVAASVAFVAAAALAAFGFLR